MKFSILIPVYNGANFINRCLDSVLNQVYDNYEIIVLDDGSTDNTLKIVSNYQNKKIRIISRKNKGISATRTELFKLARGDYCIFLDADDYINKNLLFKLNEYIENNSCDIIRYNGNYINLDGTISNKYVAVDFPIMSGIDYVLFGSNKGFRVGPLYLYTYKLEFIKKCNVEFFEGKLHEDFYNIYILSCAKSIGYIDYIGYNYVKNNNSITSKKDDNQELKRCNDILFVFDNVMKLIKKIPYIDEEKYLLLYRSSFDFLYVGLNNLNQKQKIIYSKEIKKRLR